MKLSEFKKIVAAWPDHEDAEVWIEAPPGASNLVQQVLRLSQHDMILSIAPGAHQVQPLAILLWCPECGARHIDTGEFTTKVHHTHACQSCGHVWRPAIEPTIGVRFLPGFKNA